MVGGRCHHWDSGFALCRILWQLVPMTLVLSFRLKVKILM